MANPREMAAKLRREHSSTCRTKGHPWREWAGKPEPLHSLACGDCGRQPLEHTPGPCNCAAGATNEQVDALLAAIDEEMRHADRLAERLIAVRGPLAELAAPQESYGSGGGDPRDFTPDPECSTEEERARHAADCEKAMRGEPIDTLTGCHVEGAALVSYQGWGLGTYTYRDEDAGRALADLDDALAAHRARRGG